MSLVRKLIAAAALSTALFAIAAPSQAATNLLLNGDFEIAGVGGVNDPADWTVTGMAARSDGAEYVNCCGAYNGNLNDHFATFGWGNVSGYDAISQSFASVLGKLYTLTFDAGALGANTNVLVTSADGMAPLSIVVQGNNNLASTFASHTYTFLGTGGLQTVTFAVTTGADNTDAIIDNVSLTAVPEPTSWALMIGGFGLAGAALRRRRAATVAA